MLKTLLIVLTGVSLLFAVTSKDSAQCPKDKKNCPTSKACPYKPDSTGKCPMMKDSSKAAAPAAKTGTAPSKTALSEQKTCPIMGGAINKKFFVDYEGKRIYVCCPDCLAPVKKDPKAAIKKLESLGEAPETLVPAKGMDDMKGMDHHGKMQEKK
ncbi:MAG: hypothetical protein V1913_11890 [Fibrobacterota bacterium]